MRVPELVRQRANANGTAGQSWLDDLAGTVDDLARRWGLSAVGEAMDGGTASFVAPVTDAAGERRVLKIAMCVSQDDVDRFRSAVLVHQLADGRGCVRLVDHDDDARAMLLEQLGPNLHDLALPVPEILDAVSATLQSFWRPLPEAGGLPTGPAQAVWLADFITTTWEELGEPCAVEVVDRAVTYCHERAAAFDDSAAVLVHGDAHGWNTLQADPPGTYKLVDPEGLWSEREHDLGVLLREYNLPLLAGDTASLVRERADRLAARCDADAERIWQWGFIERVSTGLASLRDFDDSDDARAFLEVAARCDA